MMKAVADCFTPPAWDIENIAAYAYILGWQSVVHPWLIAA